MSQTSVTLRSTGGDLPQSYDEYVYADHQRWVRAGGRAGEMGGGRGRWRRHSDSDHEETSNSSCSSSSYVTWTKSSLCSKQWQLLNGRPLQPAEQPARQPAASRILKDDGAEEFLGGEAADGCVAVLAPCHAAPAPSTPAVSLVTMATKTPKQKPRRERRGQQERSEFDGLLQYLQDYRHGLRELLVNNNVVIIEPVRASQAARRQDEHRRAFSAPGEDQRDDLKACRSVTGARARPRPPAHIPWGEVNCLSHHFREFL